MPDLEDPESDHLSDDLEVAAKLFREFMSACEFNFPSNLKLDQAMQKLLEARNLIYEALIQNHREDRQDVEQLSFEFDENDSGALRFRYLPQIQPRE